MRNVFDHYSQAENQLTHALFSALENDQTLLRSFVKDICCVTAPKTSNLRLSVQKYPFARLYDDTEVVSRNIPDAWIFDDEGFALVFEAKITANLTTTQLRGHQRVANQLGFEDAYYFTVVGEQDQTKTDGWTELLWSEIYVWLRRHATTGTWAKHAAEYFEVLEARMLEQGTLGNAEITKFDGFSSYEDGYSYLVAKAELRKAMRELRSRNDLAEQLNMDPNDNGRGAITGKSEQSVWDYLAMTSGLDTPNFTGFMHLTVGLGVNGVEAMVTIPNGLASKPKKALKKLGLDGFRALCAQVLENLQPVLSAEPSAVPTMRGVQRRYPSQRSVPFVDASLNFDLRTAFASVDGPKYQPQWFDSLYNAFLHKGSNYQFQIGVVFKHEACEAMKSAKSLDLLSKSWIACKPLISAARLAQP
ncbi:hypothetical protein [Halocynthiibacter sp.]|uniref:hypothetical protein n=1 Tax=Halocynthiibacter sp. TaxID=1979210 RepID=UPI003C3760A3